MMKFILSALSLLITMTTMAQVTFTITPPSPIAGSYDVTYVDGADWGTPDLTDPANALVGTFAIVDDGTAGDSLGCNALVNGAALMGKIALVYRGACQFGTKALNAQNAGAVAVVIINNIPGNPVGMGGGTDGPSVTVPVYMVSDIVGALVVNELANGNDPSVFLGNKDGFAANDIGTVADYILKPRYTSLPRALAQDSTEFSVQTGVWVKNFGQNDQSNITVTTEVVYNGTVQSSSSAGIPALVSGDSFFVVNATPYSQATYPNGSYAIRYNMTSDSADFFASDNTIEAPFVVTNNSISYAPLNANLLPTNGGSGYGDNGSNPSTPYSTCVSFYDDNAGRLTLDSMGFTMFTFRDSITNEVVDLNIYEWEDNVFNDTLNEFDSLTLVGSGLFSFDNAGQESQVVVGSLNGLTGPGIQLQDSTGYLFCVTPQRDSMFSFISPYSYGENYEVDSLNGPFLVIGGPATTDWDLFIMGPTPSVIFYVTSPLVGLENEESTALSAAAYPNPTTEVIRIPLKSSFQSGELTIMDLTGRVVYNENVVKSSNELKVDVKDIPAGLYIFNLSDSQNNKTSFKVMINR